jgi:subtilisin family serine protease
MNNKKRLFIMLFAGMALASFAQITKGVNSPKGYPWGKCFMYRLYLTDKKPTEYKISKPERFLSPKALERRKRQNLDVDSTDLPIPLTYIHQIEAQGVKVMSRSRWNNTVVVRVADKAMVDNLLLLPFVGSAKKVWSSPDTLKVEHRMKCTDKFPETDRNEGHYYGAGGAQIGLLNGKPLHDAGFKGKGMTIAILDGGFMNADRMAMMKNIKILGHRDFVATPTTSIFDETEHGTMVLSCMGMNRPEYFVGTAPEAEYWLLRSEDNATETLVEEDYWAAAVEFADSVGVDVINSSLGYQDFDEEEMNHTYPELNGHTALISRTASMLAYKGIIHVNSAGNDGMNVWKKVNFPADATDILAVGAVNMLKNNAAFSSVGPSDDGRVKPDVMSLGSPAAVVDGKGTIGYNMGTSFSAPIMAGMVTCLWQALPHKTAFEIMDLVRKSGNNYDTPNNVMGYGIPDFLKAWENGRNK